MNVVPVSEAVKLTPSDWERVHERVQSILEPLRERIRQKLPGIRAAAGKTSARAFPLFTYCQFGWSNEPDLEEVVAGLNFSPQPELMEFLICGDIGGAETGLTYFEISARVPEKLDDVLAAASSIAVQLAREDEVIVKALMERHMAPDCGKGAE